MKWDHAVKVMMGDQLMELDPQCLMSSISLEHYVPEEIKFEDEVVKGEGN